MPQTLEINQEIYKLGRYTLQATYPLLSLGGDYKAVVGVCGGGGSTQREAVGALEQSENPQSTKFLRCQGGKAYRKKWDGTQDKFLLP